MQKETFFQDVLLNKKNAEILQVLSEICEYIEHDTPFLYNPLLICGKTETGKSHITAALAKYYPQNVHTIQGGDLVYQNAEDKDKLQKAFAVGKKVKVLIIDDIQRFKDENALQEQIVYFLDKLSQHILIVLFQNSDNEVSFSKNFKSTISKGIRFDLQEPDLEIKVLYTQKYSDEKELSLTKEQCLHIARRSSGFRNIQNIINHIHLYKKQMNRMPTTSDIELITAKRGYVFTANPDIIIATVAEIYGFTAKQIVGKKRYPKIAEARHLCIYLCRTLLGITYMEIGKIFGGKDHSTIVYSIKKIEEMIVTNKVMNNLVTEVTMLCKKNLSNMK